MKRKEIQRKLQQFKEAGYTRVSLHEFSWSVKVDKDQVLHDLRSTGFDTTLADGEHYIKLGDLHG